MLAKTELEDSTIKKANNNKYNFFTQSFFSIFLKSYHIKTVTICRILGKMSIKLDFKVGISDLEYN